MSVFQGVLVYGVTICTHSGALRTGSSCFVRAALGQALSHRKPEGGCIYVNNAEPWNAIKYLRYHDTD